MTQRWKNRPPHSNWGDFGPDDQVGRLNLITPERRLAAMREVQEGIASASACRSTCRAATSSWRRAIRRERGTDPREQGHAGIHFPMALRDPRWIDHVCDDYVKLYTQYSTQWDALCHVGRRFDADGDGEAEIVYYNGFRARARRASGPDDGDAIGARHLGIEKMAETCVQGRGVLIDLHAHFGSAPHAGGLR